LTNAEANEIRDGIYLAVLDRPDDADPTSCTWLAGGADSVTLTCPLPIPGTKAKSLHHGAERCGLGVLSTCGTWETTRPPAVAELFATASTEVESSEGSAHGPSPPSNGEGRAEWST
jgi:hypothetical protein